MERKKFSNSKYRGIVWLITMIFWVIGIIGYFHNPMICWACIYMVAIIWNLEMFYDIYYWVKSKPTKKEWRNGIIHSILFISLIVLFVIVILKYF